MRPVRSQGEDCIGRDETGRGRVGGRVALKIYTPVYDRQNFFGKPINENKTDQPTTGCDHYEVKEKTALGGMRQRWARGGGWLLNIHPCL